MDRTDALLRLDALPEWMHGWFRPAITEAVVIKWIPPPAQRGALGAGGQKETVSGGRRHRGGQGAGGE